MYKAQFYWTGNYDTDAVLINKPHIEKEGENENRITATLEVFQLLDDMIDFHGGNILTPERFLFNEANIMNIQNLLLKENNWKGIRPGYRLHNVSFSDTPDFTQVPELFRKLLPLKMPDNAITAKQELLTLYEQIQTIHPLSDLNGRVFGIIISVLYKHVIAATQS